jgi:hypothetical protein
MFLAALWFDNFPAEASARKPKVARRKFARLQLKGHDE